MREIIEERSSPTGLVGDVGAEREPQEQEKKEKRTKHRRPSTTRVSKVARGLGWFSVGLGLSELILPGGMARLVGMRNKPATRWLLRALGARELAAGVGLLTQPARPGWLWTRVAGDLMDLAVLGVAMASPRTNRVRTSAATAAVLGVTVFDAWAGQRALAAGPTPVRKAITIARSPDDVYLYWRDLTNLPRFMTRLVEVEVVDERRSRWLAAGPAGASVVWDAEILEDNPGELISWRTLDGAAMQHEGTVRFSPAPDGTGTEVRVELRYGPQQGLGAALRSIVEPVAEVVIGGQMEADLGRFKQLLETGEVARSDASIHRGRHAARPRAISEKTEGES